MGAFGIPKTADPTPPPAVPGLLTPSSGALIDPPAFTERWRKVAGAVLYHLQVSESSTFQNTLVNDSTLVDTLRLVSSLKSGTTYYTRVRAKGPSSWGNYSSTVQFATSTAAPAAPSLLSPAAGAAIDPPTVTARWRKVTGAVAYHLQVAENSSFQNALVNDSTLADTLRQVSSLKSSTTYYIRLRAKGASSGWGVYGSTTQFTTTATAAPAAPSLLSPAAGAAIDPPTVTARWRKVTGAVAYHLQVAENSSFQNALVNDSTLADTLRQVSSLKSSTTYYIRLRAKGASSGWGVFGSTTQFTTTATAAPAAPSLLSPAAGAAIDPPTVTARWRKVTGAVAYHLQVAENSSFQNALVNDSTLADTLRQVSSLKSSTTYYIRLRAKGASSGWGVFGSTTQFTTTSTAAPAAPSLLSPRQGWVISPAWLYVRWQKVPGALLYHLQLAESDAFQNVLLNDSTLADTTSGLGPLEIGTTYYIRVRAKGTTSWGSYSTVVQFVTSTPPPAVPPLVTPAPGAVIDPPSFTARWRNVSGAVAYHLQLADNSSFQNAVVNDSTLADTLRQVSSLKSSTTYYIRLRAKGASSGWSVYGSTAQFTTTATPPEIIDPQKGSKGHPTSFKSRWNRSLGATLYHIQIADNITFQNPVLDDSTIADTVRQVSLEENTQYYCRLRAKGKSVTRWGVFGSATDFTTGSVNSSEGDNEKVPRMFSLAQNYPNPFNPSTTIRFALPIKSHVRLIVYNTLGQLVRNLMDSEQEPGYFEVHLDGANLASGIYYYQLQANKYTDTKKLMLLK